MAVSRRRQQAEVWLVIDRKARAPKSGTPALRIVRMSGEALRAGVEERR